MRFHRPIRYLVALGALAVAGVGAALGTASTPAAAPQASAASCVGWTPAQELQEAKVVFVGVMLSGPSDRTGELLSPAKVRVVRYLKGRGRSRVRVETAIRRSGNSYVVSSEGIDPKAGQRWKVYSNSNRQPYPTSVCTGSQKVTRRSRSAWPFTPSGPVGHQARREHISHRAAELKISWIGGRRRAVVVSNRRRVERIARIVGELPEELPDTCHGHGFIEGPPTLELEFRSQAGRPLATASQAAHQNYGIAYCVPTTLSVVGRSSIRLEGGSYLLARAQKILKRDLAPR